MAGRRQHYIPASLIGGFGAPDGSGRLRNALVEVRRHDTGFVYSTKAGEVALTIDTYRLSNPPLDIDADIIDHLWDAIEPNLPGMASRLDARALDADDPDRWIDYVATVFVRNQRLFARVVGAANLGRGAPAPTKDELLLTIPAAIRKFRAQAAELRWRVLHSPPYASRFLMTDLGFSSVTDPVYPLKCFWIPVGPRVGLLGYPDDPQLPRRRPPFTEHLVLTPEWARWFAATALPGTGADRSHTVFPTVTCGHPDDKQRLIDAIGTNGLPPLKSGPYRSRRRSTGSLID